ncbi:MAG: TlpA disulfide reductase family protein [Acidobacteria bacterium]|nr:TlpA disulfide reductase family protein [Acidobacteriota bacterium]
MTERSASTLLAVLAFLLVVPAAARGPELSLPGLGGGRLSEGELAQGTHIIVFWASWAPRGHDVVERVNKLVERWGRRARVITVNFQEDESAVRKFLRDKPNLEAEVFLDRAGELSKKYRVNSAPWLLILKDGRTSFSERLPADPHPVVEQILG